MYAYVYTATVCVWACVRLLHAHGVSSYNFGDGCTTKSEIILIQFQLFIFRLRFILIFSIFSVIVIVIVNRIKFYLLTE